MQHITISKPNTKIINNIPIKTSIHFHKKMYQIYYPYAITIKIDYQHKEESDLSILLYLDSAANKYYFLFGFLLIANNRLISSNKELSVNSNISHFPSW